MLFFSELFKLIIPESIPLRIFIHLYQIKIFFATLALNLTKIIIFFLITANFSDFISFIKLRIFIYAKSSLSLIPFLKKLFLF
jgi:hypothetical protein